MWKVIENAYGDYREIKGFKTKADALFWVQCTRCAEKGANKIAPGVYEFDGRDLIERE